MFHKLTLAKLTVLGDKLPILSLQQMPKNVTNEINNVTHPLVECGQSISEQGFICISVVTLYLQR